MFDNKEVLLKHVLLNLKLITAENKHEEVATADQVKFEEVAVLTETKFDKIDAKIHSAIDTTGVVLKVAGQTIISAAQNAGEAISTKATAAVDTLSEKVDKFGEKMIDASEYVGTKIDHLMQPECTTETQTSTGSYTVEGYENTFHTVDKNTDKAYFDPPLAPFMHKQT